MPSPTPMAAPLTTSEAPVPAKEAGAEDKPKPKKMCCACPDSKRERDECIVQNGEDACKVLIEAHKVCLRKEGFNV